MNYSFSQEIGTRNFDELEPMYRQHYSEMKDRLSSDGVKVSPFNPRWDEYFKSWESDHLLNYVIRTKDGKAVGYSNIYLTHDMHNKDLIAQEDTIFVLKEHRNGVGRRFSKYILNDLERRGVKRLNVTAITDLRVAKLWKRMGFKHTAHAMTYTFQGENNVRTFSTKAA